MDGNKPRLTAVGEVRRQYAALPWRRAEDGRVEILLITSRETRRWVLPKGWPMLKHGPAGAAAQEALEEAGVRGRIAAKPVGSYRYDKRLKTGRLQPVMVKVFALEVLKERRNWREKGQRAKQWVSPAEAAAMVDEADLADLLRGFEGS